MTLHAVLFDFDGTLVDSEPVHLRIWNEVLRPYGLSVTVNDFKHRYLGVVATEMAHELVVSNQLDVDPGALAAEKDRKYDEWVQENPLPLMAYARESIVAFRQCGMKLACVTGSRRSSVALTLQRYTLFEKFSVLVSREDVRQSKPDPECYRTALAWLSESQDSAIAFEDSEAGVLSATGAGLVCYGIVNESSRNHDLSWTARTFSGLEEATRWVMKHYGL